MKASTTEAFADAGCKQIAHELEPDGRYRIDHYDLGPAFSSFLPGVAGPLGVPTWCFYVNRAQAVVSFGVRDKDNAIAEFFPATAAYQLVGTHGFRTFCELDGRLLHEPFHSARSASEHVTRSMWIELDRVSVQERDFQHKLECTVEYFSPVNRPVGMLLRRVTIRNLADRPRALRVLDGLPVFVPAGITDIGLKRLRHISEAYVHVRMLEPRTAFAASKVGVHDEAEVREVRHGHFFAAWRCGTDSLEALDPVVDPGVVFGAGHDLLTPRAWFGRNHSDVPQMMENRLPCAFAPASVTLASRESLELWSVYGHAEDADAAREAVAAYSTPAEFARASDESRALLRDLTDAALTCSESPLLDAYARQNYLDNVLRGGVPMVFPSRNGPTPLHLYARRHGDLERDYNDFVLSPTPLSTGPGNYRDICQNRRSDVWFYPHIGSLEIRTFVELLQPDGYNPLSIAGYQWILANDADPDEFCPCDTAEARRTFRRLVTRPFLPGDVLAWAQAFHLSADYGDEWFTRLLEACDRRLSAAGHEGGYWIDHWTYIADILEAYAAIYPDRMDELLHHDTVAWWDEAARVVPRTEKYIDRGGRWQQLDAVKDAPPRRNPLPAVTIFAKLCALVAIKAVSFDPTGRGIEMEAGRPGWNDAMNGLPALFGSSTCEAAELARLAAWLRSAQAVVPDIRLPACVAELVRATIADVSLPAFDWDRAATIREQYRKQLAQDRVEALKTIPGPQIEQLLDGVLSRAERAVEQSFDESTGLTHTYYEHLPSQAKPFGARPTDSPAAVQRSNGRSTPPHSRRPVSTSTGGSARYGFTARPLPLYLEGQVHRLKLLSDPDAARRVYQAVRRSPLFDEALRMYKLNECVERCSPRIGRARTFTRGWFENESIWLHMSYKYLYELLRAGLHAEFFEDAHTMLVPFMPPLAYGRSVLENSSFLGSSANPDPATHGRGFIARLSGSSAEFISIWLHLTTGGRPFSLEEGELTFTLRPVLPGEWFRHSPGSVDFAGRTTALPENTFACTLLGRTLLVYHNHSRQDTFGPHAVRPTRYVIDDQTEIAAPAVTGEPAHRIRAGRVRRLDVWLGATDRE